ncbi:MAG: helix-turn-helix transcriptional regulator [Deltaproteobacteria bacterium]|nr:helix-turn-helix transcriptional regulator [Deltaproteobacteria bacterium]MBW2382193.1 helix-turn-helix transcriptional regulator [Deltaproteobacteria bacterium]
MSKELKRVAERLRAWRDDAGWSLASLATRSGVAASTIQKIERQQMVPTIAVLLKIAHGLGRRPAEFVEDDGDGFEVVHQQQGERQTFPDGKGGQIERIGGDLVDPACEAWRVVHPPGGGIDRSIRFDGEQLMLCESGTLTVTVDDTRYELSAGATLHFKARLAHSWSNEGDEPVQFLIIGTLPRGMRGLFSTPSLPGHEYAEGRVG